MADTGLVFVARRFSENKLKTKFYNTRFLYMLVNMLGCNTFGASFMFENPSVKRVICSGMPAIPYNKLIIQSSDGVDTTISYIL